MTELDVKHHEIALILTPKQWTDSHNACLEGATTSQVSTNKLQHTHTSSPHPTTTTKQPEIGTEQMSREELFAIYYVTPSIHKIHLELF